MTTNIPLELIQEVIDDYAKLGQTLTAEEAKRKVPESRISALIESEVKEKWPNEYESMLRKQEHNQRLLNKKMFAQREAPIGGDSKIEPVLSREEWEAAQAKLSEDQDDGQGSPVMKME